MPTLTIEFPGQPPVSHILKEETATVGRMKGNSIVVDDHSVSLAHARITRTREGEFILKDLNSTNGTTLNGQGILEAKLRDKDRVRFANIDAQFFSEPALAPATASASAPSTGVPAPAPVPVSTTTTTAPASNPPAAPIPAAAPGKKPGRKLQLTPTLVGACVGGVAVLGVLSFAGWKFTHLGKSAEVASSAPVQAPAPVSKTSVSAPAAPAAAHSKDDILDIERRLAAAGDNTVVAAAVPAEKPIEVTSEAMANLVRALSSSDAVQRRQSAITLHSIGTQAKPATAALRETLHDSDAEVRLWSALTLINNQCYDKATIPILVQVLQNDSPVLRQVAALSLGLIPFEEADKQTVVPVLAQAAGKDADEDVRKAAVSALTIIAPEALSPPTGN